MQTTYQNDFQHNYLILHPDKETDMSAYPVRMLLNNDIPPLLSCTIQSVDGQKNFYYDITDKSPLTAFYEKDKLDFDNLRLLFCRFTEAAEQIGSHLLDVNDLVMAPEYVYIDQQNTLLQFCYLPGYGIDVRNQFRSFTEYLLPKIDHKDQDAVVLGYGIYRQSLEENFHLDQVKEHLFRTSSETASQIHTYETIPDEEDSLRQKALQDFFEDDDSDCTPTVHEPIPWSTIITSAAWTIALLGICILRYLGYFSFLTLPMMLGVFILVLVIIALNTIVWKKQKSADARMPEKWLQPNVTQASIQWPCKKSDDTETHDEGSEENKAEWQNPPTPPLSSRAHPPDTKDTQPYTPDIGDTQPLPQLNLSPGGTLISKDPQRLTDISLTGDLTLIGKLNSRVDAVIPLPTVSRIHAKLCRVDQEYYLMDLNSKNGTYLNGQLLPGHENRRLSPGDEVAFADASYTFAL